MCEVNSWWRRFRLFLGFLGAKPIDPNDSPRPPASGPQKKDFQPIPVEELPSEYLLKHRDSDFLFAMEFEALPHYSNFDTAASDRLDNARKNRYNDIKAYDVTRVKLHATDDDDGSDYINANFVQGYKGRKTFVAAQGPLAETVPDFWRMVWEYRIQLIVMVTNLQEKYRAQCSKYWPDEAPAVYGSVEVSPQESFHYADYAIRKFNIRKGWRESVDGEAGPEAEWRPVVQYHYTGWHDYRAPECTTGLLRFLMRLRKLDQFVNEPVAVHCSAGVGRTGTFVAIDGILDQCQEEGKADVFGFVSNLRRQRNFMVQSLEQYVFVYKALAEWFTFGDTDVEMEKIRSHVASLREPVQGSNTKMKLQYQQLEHSLENARACEFARKDGNERKNRSEAILPFDRNRVILAPVLGQVDASYINASIVRGYFSPYILAQDPMSNTIWDFWRMISEQNAACIVSLTPESEMSPDEKYWPEDSGKGMVFGDAPAITVQLTAEEETSSSIIVRKLSYSSTKEKELREVHQFVFGDWASGSPAPPSAASFLELIGKVFQRQSNLRLPTPIVIHCRDGGKRSALYCLVSLVLERLKAEGRVDVFQTAKNLQAQRSRVISNFSQYEFCYQCVLDYLESFP